MNTMTKMTTEPDADEPEPQFESVEAMCAAFNWPASICEKILRDMESTAPGMEATGLPDRGLH